MFPGHRRRGGSGSTASSSTRGSLTGYNRKTKLIVKRSDGKEVCRKITLVNYDTDLPGLMATLQFSLQSSPGDPLVPLKKLSYRDSPKTQPLVSLDESTFNRELFLPMTKVCLLAVVEAGGGGGGGSGDDDSNSNSDSDSDEIFNDENDRRLSNGSTPSILRATPTSEDSNKNNFDKKDSENFSPTKVSSPGDVKRNGRITGSSSGSTSKVSPPSSRSPICRRRGGEGSPGDEVSGERGKCNGVGGGERGSSRRSADSGWESSWDLCSANRGGSITPTASSVADQVRQDNTSAISTAAEDGPAFAPGGVCAEEPLVATPGPGRRSKLFRRKSLERKSLEADLDNADSGAAGRDDGGGDDEGGGSGTITPQDSVDDSSIFSGSTNSSGSSRRKHLSVRDAGRGRGQGRGDDDTTRNKRGRGGSAAARGAGRGKGSSRRSLTGVSSGGSGAPDAGRDASARKEVPQQSQPQARRPNPLVPARKEVLQQPQSRPRGQNPLLPSRKEVPQQPQPQPIGQNSLLNTENEKPAPPPASSSDSSSRPLPSPPAVKSSHGSPRPTSPRPMRKPTTATTPTTSTTSDTKPSGGGSKHPKKATGVMGAAAAASKLPQKAASSSSSSSSSPSSCTPLKTKPKLPARPGVVAAGEKHRKPNLPARPGAPAPPRGGAATPVSATTPKRAEAAGKGGADSQPRVRSPRPKAAGGRPKPSPVSKADDGVVGEDSEIKTPRVSAVFSWERDLRRGGGFKTGSGKTPTKKGAGSGDAMPPPKHGAGGKGRGAWRRGMKGVGGGGGDGRGGGGDGRGGKGLFEGDESDESGGADGRPSIGTWNKTQDFLQILKEISGKDEEELEWLAVAKKGEGVMKSEKRRESAETAYHRLLCEESMHQAGLKLLQDRKLEKALRAVASVGDELKRLNEVHEELGGQENALNAEDNEAEYQAAVAATAAVDEQQSDMTAEELQAAAAERAAAREASKAAAEAARVRRQEEKRRLADARQEAEAKVSDCLEDIKKAKVRLKAVVEALREGVSGKDGEGAGAGGIGAGSALQTVVGIMADVCSAMEFVAPDRATSGLRSLERAAEAVKEEMNKSRAGAQAALSKMEKWRQRKEALPEYEKEMADQERSWFEREKDANQRALKRMRALIPVGVTGLTVAQLEHRAIESGSLYPKELALRLKTNRLLHWTVEHPDDIARANFLRGDHAHFFTNLDRYDLVELRAVTACLPERFEVDGDGRKAAWRAGFLQRVQGMVAQERGDTVSGGWDPEAGKRRTVTLPALSPEQARRPEYFYPTRANAEERLEKLRQRGRRLDEKRAKLERIKEVSLPEAREEYVNVLEDTRHPANKELYPAEDLRRARDEAKAEVDSLAKEAKQMEGDVAATERALREGTYTVESLQAEMEATKALLLKRAVVAAAAKEEEDNTRCISIAAEKKEQQHKQENASTGRGEDGSNGSAKKSEGGNDTEGGKAVKQVGATSSATGDATEIADSARAGGGDRVRLSENGGVGESSSAMSLGGKGEDREPLSSTSDASVLKAMEDGMQMEVEGPFEPEPELKSRLADRSTSLKFVTAEEDARMRKEELAKAMAAREPPPEEAQGLSAEASERGRARAGASDAYGVTVGHGAAPPATGASGSDGADGAAEQADGIVGDGQTAGNAGKSRIKAFGAVLEKTLSHKFFARATGVAPGGGAPKSPRLGGGVGAEGPGRGKFLSSSPRSVSEGVSGEARSPRAAVTTPPCKPKSKFFKSINGNRDATGEGGKSGGTSPSDGQFKPPPAPPLGFLAQIRERAGAGAGGAGAAGDSAECANGDASTRRRLVPPSAPPAAMGGLLAQIRARSRNPDSGDNSSSKAQEMEKVLPDACAPSSDDTAVEDAVAASFQAPPPPPPPPSALPLPPPLKPRSLFGKPAGGPAPAPAGPPPNFLAEVRAKAAARAALRGLPVGDGQ